MTYFVDVNGVIYSISEDGRSNHPGKLRVENNKVFVLDSDGSVLDEYQLWDSLLSLAVAIEGDSGDNHSGPLHINQAINQMHYAVDSFKNTWMNGHKQNPEHFPLTLPEDNSGIFFEQLFMSMEVDSQIEDK
ncbi:TPA: hypothetical protein ACGIK9_003411 [Acinetobacter baumannii]|uniref:hypothetical protein n=1 Tax=Acinetobacter baumannii TaxID=470 RepID=UPI00338E6CDE